VNTTTKDVATDDRSHAWIGVVVTVLAFAVISRISFFYSDSWTYLELSNTVFGDFYRINTLRQYASDTPYSTAFPPLWPVLIALARKVCEVGLYAGAVLNLFVCFGLLAAMIRLVRQLDMPAWTGTAAYLSVLACESFIEDALAARTCALSILFFTLTLATIVRPFQTPRSAALAGLWTGLACMSRFDMVPVAAGVGLLLALQAYKSGLRHAVRIVLAYSLVLVAVMSPWIVYSWTHFGTPFASDNSRQVLMASGGHVINYSQTPPEADLFVRPITWIWGFFTGKLPITLKGLAFCFINSATLVLFAAVVIVWAGKRYPYFNSQVRRFAAAAVFLDLLSFLAPALVGYSDERYFIPAQLTAVVLLFAALATMLPAAWNGARVFWFLMILAIGVIPHGAFPWLVKHREQLQNSTWFPAPVHATPNMLRVATAVDRDSAGKWNRILVISPDPEGWNEWIYGALTGRQGVVTPRFKSGNITSFIRDWHVTHLYDGQRQGGFVDPAQANLVPLEVPGLYRVKFRTPEK
jgi:hypothetical protein